MFVYLFLSFANRFVPASAYDIPLRRVEREIFDRHPLQMLPKDKYQGLPHEAVIPKWNSFPKHPENAIQHRNPGDVDFKKGGKLSDWEISKSIELTFDPNNEVLKPVSDVSKTSLDAYKSSLSLLSTFTQKGLSQIIEKYEKEAKEDAKNYQTGRFKIHYLKRTRIRV